MAERPERPAVPAAGWRSRSGVVRVAAVLLGLFGLLLVLIEADQGELGVAVVVTGLVLLFAAAALVWAGRLAADITLPVRTLDIDPALLYKALRYHHQHPQARAELATQDVDWHACSTAS